MNTTERKCQNCSETIKGRSDKKFCDDHCRSAYYNEKKANETNTLIKQTNTILRKNRQILQNLNPTGMVKTTRKTLIEKGFNFGYYTGIYKTARGSNYFFCYEMGYLSLQKDEVLLVKKAEFPRLQG